MNVSGIGDFVDGTPALRLLRWARPESRITVLVAEKVLPLAAACPYVDEAVGLPTMPGRSIPSLGGVPRWIRRVWSLRGRFTRAVCFYEIASRPGEWWIRLLLSWIGADISVGRLTDGRGMFFDRVAPDPPQRDVVDACLSVVSLALFPGPCPVDREKKLEVRIPKPKLEAAQRWLDGLVWPRELEGLRVVVALGGDRRTRHEFPERAEQWLLELQREFKIRPIIFGARSDPGLPAGTKVVHADARGRMDILESAGLISRSDVVITTHSAPQHLASAWNIPVVVLVGPGDPVKYRPHLAENRMRLLRNPVPCSPCYFQDCPRPRAEYKRCMAGISPEEIVRAFRELLPAAAGKG